MASSIKVVNFISSNSRYSWKVYQHGVLIGHVYCNDEGEQFNGSLRGYFEADKLWDEVQELCINDLVDQYLIDGIQQLKR